MDHLEGHLAIHTELLRRENEAHPAATHKLQDLVSGTPDLT